MFFLGDERYHTLKDMVSLVTSQPGIDPTQISSMEGWLERQSHQSAGGFPVWESWTKENKTHFNLLCGSLMERLGYVIR